MTDNLCCKHTLYLDRISGLRQLSFTYTVRYFQNIRKGNRSNLFAEGKTATFQPSTLISIQKHMGWQVFLFVYLWGKSTTVITGLCLFAMSLLITTQGRIPGWIDVSCCPKSAMIMPPLLIFNLYSYIFRKGKHHPMSLT